MLKNKKIFAKIMQLFACIAIVFSVLVIATPSDVHAANPVLKAQIKENGVLVDLGTKTATTTVYLVSDTACMIYLNQNPLTESYVTSYPIESGYGSFQYSCIDRSGNSSNIVNVKLDMIPPIIVLLNESTTNSVRISSMKQGYYVINGVKKDVAESKITLTDNGSYTVSQFDTLGRESNVISFSIPYTAPVVTTTTTKKVTTKPVVTTKKPTTTSTSVSKIDLSMVELSNGATTNNDVVINATSDVYFVVNGVKQAKLAKTITITEDGTHSVSAINAKNVTSDALTFTIDRQVPKVTLEVAGLEVTPGIFEDAVTIFSDKAATFIINGVEREGITSSVVIAESGTYTVEVVDAAGNITSVDFVVNMPIVDEPKENPSSGSNPLIYIVGGALAGAAAVGGILFFMKWKKGKEESED